ncbi:hypothetical protein EV356DRAFT_496085 [Viridothelium virens]|uniref:F-box domain-containing protein n=1 Tax=Viridothelium virens TaxID=1048519 RepID=A0A6A6HHE9_VIRVR|nr:hypothetical protein EV356DRAFT_496085 [Viridothelium virens]
MWNPRLQRPSVSGGEIARPRLDRMPMDILFVLMDYLTPVSFRTLRAAWRPFCCLAPASKKPLPAASLEEYHRLLQRDEFYKAYNQEREAGDHTDRLAKLACNYCVRAHPRTEFSPLDIIIQSPGSRGCHLSKGLLLSCEHHSFTFQQIKNLVYQVNSVAGSICGHCGASMLMSHNPEDFYLVSEFSLGQLRRSEQPVSIRIIEALSRFKNPICPHRRVCDVNFVCSDLYSPPTGFSFSKDRGHQPCSTCELNDLIVSLDRIQSPDATPWVDTLVLRVHKRLKLQCAENMRNEWARFVRAIVEPPPLL